MRGSSGLVPTVSKGSVLVLSKSSIHVGTLGTGYHDISLIWLVTVKRKDSPFRLCVTYLISISA